MTMGQTAYFGPAAESLAHFANLGYEPKGMVNPADYLLEVCVGCHRFCRGARTIRHVAVCHAWCIKARVWADELADTKWPSLVSFLM